MTVPWVPQVAKEPPQHGSTGGQNGYDQHRQRNVTVRFIVNEKGNPPGKLADVELHFNDGVLAGLKLIGFAVWERRSGGGRNVTVPARQYSVNGERRSFALLRPIEDVTAQARIRGVILEAYADLEAGAA